MIRRAAGAVVAVLAVILLGPSYAWAAEPQPAGWECVTDAAGVQSCTVTTWTTPAPEPTGPAPVVVVQPSGEPVPVVEQNPQPAGEPGTACGSVEEPCVSELGGNSTAVVGSVGLASVFIGGTLIALGLRSR